MGDPYREGRPLAQLIEPDRRRQRAIMLVAGGMIAGVVLWQGARWLAEDTTEPPIPPFVPKPPETVTPPRAFEPGPLTQDEIQREIAKHRVAVKRTCWEGLAERPREAKVTLDFVVGANGDVVDLTWSGDALVASCLEQQARTWQFPAHGTRSATIHVPFTFVRE